MTKDSFPVKKIARVGKATLSDLNRLLAQWSPNGRKLTPGYLKLLIKKSHLLAAYDQNTIVGIVTLIEIHKLSGKKGSIEHLMVDERYRGKKIGERLMQAALELGKKRGMDMIFLTCEPERAAANALYQKLGFKIKATNFYYLSIPK